jgi:adenylate cyclase
VNTASRLEALTKDHRVQLILSEAVIEAAGLALELGETAEISARGREQSIAVRLVADAAVLPPARPEMNAG